MSFTGVYDANKVALEDYVFSGSVIICPRLMGYDSLFHINFALSQAGFGPVKDGHGNFRIQGDKFSTGIYVKKRDLPRGRCEHHTQGLPLRQAFEELQQALY
jgi:hypothetical protein